MLWVWCEVLSVYRRIHREIQPSEFIFRWQPDTDTKDTYATEQGKCSAGKESACNVGDLDSILELGRSLGERNCYLLQYSGLENSIDCIVHRVAKSRTRLSDLHFLFSCEITCGLASPNLIYHSLSSALLPLPITCLTLQPAVCQASSRTLTDSFCSVLP